MGRGDKGSTEPAACFKEWGVSNDIPVDRHTGGIGQPELGIREEKQQTKRWKSQLAKTNNRCEGVPACFVNKKTQTTRMKHSLDTCSKHNTKTKENVHHQKKPKKIRVCNSEELKVTLNCY